MNTLPRGLYGALKPDELRKGSFTMANEIFGTEADDVLHGGNQSDTIFGDKGDDQIFGEKGDDTLYGGQGKDKLFGGDGNDTISGGNHNDGFFSGAGNDVIDGGNGSGDCAHYEDQELSLADLSISYDENSGLYSITYEVSNGKTYTDTLTNVELIKTADNGGTVYDLTPELADGGVA
jgi:Ca2+-binding RTX toxin-like protein